MASRVLVRLGRFRARGFDELQRKARRLPWDAFDAGGPASFAVTSRKSRLYHTDAVADRLAGCAPEGREGEAGTRFVVRIVRDDCLVSADSSGAHLHRRGYRLETAKAPLRETLAAAVLEISWDPVTPLVDPFCGSGTLPIEAARRAAGIPPGSDRAFTCERWPGFPGHAREHPVRRPVPAILAADRDAGAIRAAESNAGRGGVRTDIRFRCQTISELEPPTPGPGTVATNPPWGHRTGGGPALLATFGRILRTRFPGWRVAVLAADRVDVGPIGVALDVAARWVQGGVAVRVLVGRVP